MNSVAVQRIEQYFQRIGDVLGEESAGVARSLSTPWACWRTGSARAWSPSPPGVSDLKRVDAMHQRLLHFAVDSKWSNQQVRRAAVQYALEATTGARARPTPAPLRGWGLQL